MKTIQKVDNFLQKYWWTGAVIAGLGVFLISLLLSYGQSVWFDEGYSILLAKHSFSDLLSLTAVDAHPPLYYILLKLWGSVFGFGEVALRSLSAVLMGGAVMVAILLLKKLFSARVALAAVPFIVFAPFLLRYGYELRMYALATLIAVSATYTLVKARASEGWKWWLVYAVLVALGMYTLYLMVAIWISHFVWLLVVSLKDRKTPFWRWPWLYAFAGAVALFAAYIPTFLHQLIYSALPGMGSALTVPQLTNIVSTLVLYIPEWSLGGWGSLVVIGFVAIIAIFGVSFYKSLKKEARRNFMLLLSLTAVPVAFYALTSLPPRDPIFIVRYMAHSALFVYMLIGVIIGGTLLRRPQKSARAWWIAGLSLAVLFVLVYGVVSLHRTGNFNFERMQYPMTQTVRDYARCDDTSRVTVVADDPYTYIDSAFYFDSCSLKFYSENNVEYAGGYAMLHNSNDRVASAADVKTPVLIHLGWDGAEPAFKPDARYRLVDETTFDKQHIERYELIAE